MTNRQTEKQGQIVKGLSGFYYIEDQDSRKIYQTRARGLFRKEQLTPLVGDYVSFQADNPHEGVLTAVKERKNELDRPPVANIDLAFVVASVTQPQIPSKLIDRMLVYSESQRIQPALYFSKLDLFDEAEREELQPLLANYQSLGYQVLTNLDLSQADEDLLTELFHGKTIAAMGQSGVGKTTLLNHLLPDLHKETAAISKGMGRGKHTTRHVELHDVYGGKLVDTPGFSSLSLDSIEKEDLGDYFPEMRERSDSCKFRECSHTHEPHCAIKAALAAGEISQSRYDHYVEFLQEIINKKPDYQQKNRRKKKWKLPQVF